MPNNEIPVGDEQLAGTGSNEETAIINPIASTVLFNLNNAMEGHPRALRIAHYTSLRRVNSETYSLEYHGQEIARITRDKLFLDSNGYVTQSTQRRWNMLFGLMNIPLKITRRHGAFQLFYDGRQIMESTFAVALPISWHELRFEEMRDVIQGHPAARNETPLVRRTRQRRRHNVDVAPTINNLIQTWINAEEDNISSSLAEQTIKEAIRSLPRITQELLLPAINERIAGLNDELDEADDQSHEYIQGTIDAATHVKGVIENMQSEIQETQIQSETLPPPTRTFSSVPYTISTSDARVFKSYTHLDTSELAVIEMNALIEAIYAVENQDSPAQKLGVLQAVNELINSMTIVHPHQDIRRQAMKLELNRKIIEITTQAMNEMEREPSVTSSPTITPSPSQSPSPQAQGGTLENLTEDQRRYLRHLGNREQHPEATPIDIHEFDIGTLESARSHLVELGLIEYNPDEGNRLTPNGRALLESNPTYEIPRTGRETAGETPAATSISAEEVRAIISEEPPSAAIFNYLEAHPNTRTGDYQLLFAELQRRRLGGTLRILPDMLRQTDWGRALLQGAPSPTRASRPSRGISAARAALMVSDSRHLHPEAWVEFIRSHPNTRARDIETLRAAILDRWGNHNFMSIFVEGVSRLEHQQASTMTSITNSVWGVIRNTYGRLIDYLQDHPDTRMADITEIRNRITRSMGTSTLHIFNELVEEGNLESATPQRRHRHISARTLERELAAIEPEIEYKPEEPTEEERRNNPFLHS